MATGTTQFVRPLRDRFPNFRAAPNPRVTEATHWLARVNQRVTFYVLGGRSARENAAQHTLERPRGRLGFSPRAARSRIPPKKSPAVSSPAGRATMRNGKSGSDCWTRTSDPAVNRRADETEIRGASENRSVGERESARQRTPRTAEAQSVPDEQTDEAIERALLLAAEAGRFDVVSQLARELEARRLASPDNVVLLSRRRRAVT